MSELETAGESNVQGAPAGPEKKAWAERVVADILRLMGLSARLEVKDAADGGISIAVFFEGEVAGVQPGRRSQMVDALQFLANKIVNRPQTERRWISIGVGAHPEPRPARPPPPAKQAPVRAEGRPAPRPAGRPNGAAPAQRPRPAAPEEAALEVSEDADIAHLARLLQGKSARLGRHYAVLGMKAEDRARMLKSASGLTGASVRLEGEGRGRRVSFLPDKPAPMPGRALPEDEESEEE
ncbi:MAG: hypothetical protein HYZ28_12130 [Myxococcales bacterium]|nr:hypothetical protein [Myxococcales bacterium]